MMRKHIAFLFLVLVASLGKGADHKLNWDGEEFMGFWHEEIRLIDKDQRAFLHFPLQAYLDKNSFLNKQLREFQDPDLHFADDEALAVFEIIELRINDSIIPISLQEEYYEVHSEWLKSEHLSIDLKYRMRMPDAKFTGNGRLENEVRLINILPSLSIGALKPPPLSYNFDLNSDKQVYKVELNIPEGWSAISNLQEFGTKNGSILLEGKAKQFQLFLSKSWEIYNMENGGRLILPERDESFRINFSLALEELATFFKSELDSNLTANRDFLFLDKKKGEFQSERLISIERPKKWEDLRLAMCQSLGEAFFRYQLKVDGWKHPWIARGIPYYYKYLFAAERYPQKTWVPFQSPILDGLFGFDAFDFGYQNRFLFLFLQRQGLDQAMNSPVDSLSRLNYEAIIQAKAYLNLCHLRAFTGTKSFRRAMVRFYRDKRMNDDVEKLKESFEYFSPKSLDWFFKDLSTTAEIYDYQLLAMDYCPTVSTATVSNTGDLTIPYSLTGYIDGEPVITEWYEGHRGKRTVQMYHGDYDKVVLNAHLRHAEYRQKNNIVYNRFLLPRAEPLKFQLYNSFEAAEASQVFYVPSVYYNAYDQFLLGINLSNRSILVQKPFEWLAVPEYSTGTGKLTGTMSIAYNWVLPKSSIFRQIKLGLYSRYNHYDRDLAYFRISPSVNFYLRKSYPRSPYIQTIRFRGVSLNRERPQDGMDDVDNTIDRSSYSIFNANYRMEYTSILRPTIFRAHLELGEQFGKAFAEYDQRWMLPNKKWLILRGFAGAFLYNQAAETGSDDNFYSFGLSGTPDYLFDYYLIGRSDVNGIWSRQFFTTDGGFKSETGAFADQFLISGNISLPFIGPLGAFADVALSEEQVYWDYGIRLALLTDFLELYLPIQNQDRNFYSESNYIGNARFVLDLDLGSIINRLRRGYY